MPSTATARNRLEQQAPGENGNTWGDKLNTGVIALVDQALDGMIAFALSGPKTLTSTNFAADEARGRYLNVTGGTGGTVTIPNVEKLYLVRNNSSSDVILTAGLGTTTATVPSGTVTWIVCEGGDTVRALTGKNNFGTTGIIINGQTLDGLTAAGVALAEAADAAAQRTALGLGTIATRNKAATGDIASGTADTAITADVVGAGFAPVAIAYAATLAWDWRGGYYRHVVLTGNVSIGTPTNIRPGESRMIELEGNDATARTVSFSADFLGSLPSITDVTSTRKYRLVITADRLGKLNAIERRIS